MNQPFAWVLSVVLGVGFLTLVIELLKWFIRGEVAKAVKSQDRSDDGGAGPDTQPGMAGPAEPEDPATISMATDERRESEWKRERCYEGLWPVMSTAQSRIWALFERPGDVNPSEPGLQRGKPWSVSLAPPKPSVPGRGKEEKDQGPFERLRRSIWNLQRTLAQQAWNHARDYLASHELDCSEEVLSQARIVLRGLRRILAMATKDADALEPHILRREVYQELQKLKRQLERELGRPVTDPGPARPDRSFRPRQAPRSPLTRTALSSNMENLVVYCADVGAQQRDNFGWARGSHAMPASDLKTGSDMKTLARRIGRDLVAGRPVALGFECPLFVPLRKDPQTLTQARKGEGNRPWSAGAGSSSLSLGLVQVPWILAEIRRGLQDEVPSFLDWNAMAEEGYGLFLWEAFISGIGKEPLGTEPPGHRHDAMVGVRTFLDALPDPTQHNLIQEEEVLSLVGTAMLRTGWTTDLEILDTPCLVLAPAG